MKKLTAIILAAVVITVTAYFAAPPVYCRLYRGDRITGRVKMFVDDKSYPLGEKNFSVPDGGKLSEDEGGFTVVAVRADEYGAYDIVINDTPAGEPITLHCFKENWWDIQSFLITIRIDTITGDISYSGSHSCRLNNGRKFTETRPPRVFSDGEYRINL